MQEVMLSDLPVEDREDVLNANCDQIVEMRYIRKFEQQEKNEKREQVANLSIEINEINEQLKEVKAEFKAKLQPLQEVLKQILGEIKVGGESVKGNAYKMVFPEDGMVGFYAPDGHLIEARPMKPEEKQRTAFQTLRATGTGG